MTKREPDKDFVNYVTNQNKEELKQKFKIYFDYDPIYDDEEEMEEGEHANAQMEDQQNAEMEEEHEENLESNKV